MKRTPASFRFLSALVALLLVLSMIPLSVSAEEAADLYTPAADGDLLYTVNFAGDEYYQPEPLIGNNKVEVSNLDSTVATFDAGTDQLDSWWGGYIPALPLNKNTNYTIYYSVQREVTASIGIFFDQDFGAYGYESRVRLMQKADSLSGHGYKYFEEMENAVPGLGYTQEYAMEICGADQTFALYVKGDDFQFHLVDQSLPGEAVFLSDCLGFFVLNFYGNMPSELSEVNIHKGLAFSDPPEVSDGPDYELEQNHIYDVWSQEIIDACFVDVNQTEITLTDEGLRLTGVAPAEGEDVNACVNFKVRTYVEMVGAEHLSTEEYGYLVFKTKAGGTYGDYELYFITTPAIDGTAQGYFMEEDVWQCLVFELCNFESWAIERVPTNLRLTWALDYENGPENAYMVIEEIAFFKTEEEAYAYAAANEEAAPSETQTESESETQTETRPETTPTTPTETQPAPDVTVPTTDKAPETEAPKGGCGSVVWVGALPLLIGAAFVVMKKR